MGWRSHGEPSPKVSAHGSVEDLGQWCTETKGREQGLDSAPGVTVRQGDGRPDGGESANPPPQGPPARRAGTGVLRLG